MNVILARSPFQVIIDEANQINTKVELRLWNKGGTRPTNPTYIMSEGIASVTQRETNYNISPFILEYIDKYKLQYSSSTITQANNKEWCIGEYKTFYETNDVGFTLIDTVSFCAVNGYSNVEYGVNSNPASGAVSLLLADAYKRVYWNTFIPYYNFIVRHPDCEYEAQWTSKTSTILKKQSFYFGDDDYFNYYVNKKLGIIDFKNKKSFEFSNIEKYKCDNKYIVFYDSNKISIVDIENKKEISSESKNNIMFLYVCNNKKVSSVK